MVLPHQTDLRYETTTSTYLRPFSLPTLPTSMKQKLVQTERRLCNCTCFTNLQRV